MHQSGPRPHAIRSTLSKSLKVTVGFTRVSVLALQGLALPGLALQGLAILVIACVAVSPPHVLAVGPQPESPLSQPETAQSGAGSHGDLRHLEETLYRNSEASRVLEAVESAFRNGRADAQSGETIELLRSLLTIPHDAFVVDGRAGQIDGLRSRSLELLLASSREFRQQWRSALEISGGGMLQSALRSGERTRVAQVDREYPLTDVGLRAAQLMMLDHVQRGNSGEARRQAEAARTLYGADPHFRTALQKIELLLTVATRDGTPIAGRRPTAEKGASLSVLTTADAPVSRPWRKPLWTMTESALAAGSSDSDPAFVFPSETELLPGKSQRPDFSHWVPVLHPEIVISRTPFRVIGFERLTGKIQWQLPTDTFPEAESPANRVDDTRKLSEESETDDIRLPRIHDSAIASAGTFGQLSLDSEMLYFLDHFRSSSASSSAVQRLPRQFRFPGGMGGGFRGGGLRGRGVLPGFGLNGTELATSSESLLNGSTLVAIRLNSADMFPEIAWVIGSASASGFAYRLQDADRGIQQPQPAMSSETDPGGGINAFQDHVFLSLPVGQGTRLFVLSATEDEIWANCLNKFDGSLLWRQPLAYDADLMLKRLSSSGGVGVSGVCMMSETSLICRLPTDALVALRPQDGQLQWATSLRNPDQFSPQHPLLNLRSPSDSVSAFVPVTNGASVVSVATGSDFILAVDAATGKIQWQVSRQAVGPGAISRSSDTYAVRISGDQVILIGDRHCRALSLLDGTQNWAVEILPSTGRAWCGETRVLIPEVGGGIAIVDLENGAADRVSPELLAPQSAELQSGSIISDGRIVCLATPTTLTVFPSADEVLRTVDELPELKSDGVRRSLVRAQAHILNGRRDLALHVLTDSQTLVSETNAAPENRSSSPLHELAGELLLEESGLTLFPPSTAPSARTSLRNAPTDSGRMKSLEEKLALAATLRLNAGQRRRLDLFQQIATRRRGHISTDTDWSRFATGLNESSSLTAINSEWSARADLVWQTEAGTVAFGDLNVTDLIAHKAVGPSIIGQAILFPEQVGDSATRLQFAQHLVSTGQYPAAELFLLSSLARMTAADESALSVNPSAEDAASVELPSRGLREAHEKLLQITYGLVAKDSSVRRVELDQSRSVDGWDNSSSVRELTPAAPRSLVIREHDQLRSPDSLTSQVSGLRAISTLGAVGEVMKQQHRLTWFQSSEFGMATHLKAFDLLSGAAVDEVALPFNGIQVSGTDDRTFVPHVVAVGGINRIAMVSCVRPGESRLLWQRDIRAETPFGNTSIAIGPIGPDYVVWQSGTRLHCSHPLTGQDLWQRASSRSDVQHSLFQLTPLCGDQDVTVTFGGDGVTYQRYATRDGRFLNSGRLQVSRIDSVVVHGRRLLYFDESLQVRNFDAQTEHNTLEGQTPLILKSSENPFRQIDGGRVVTLSEKKEIVVIDLQAGKILFRVPTAGLLNTNAFFGLSAFESNGRLFVCVHDEQGLGAQPVATPRLGEPRVDYGTLFCLDPRTGEVLWTRRTEPAVVLDVHGDSSNVLILWALTTDEGDAFRDRSRRSVVRQLQIHAIDATTGQTIARNDRLGAAYPLRCVHDAASRQFRIICQGAVVTLTEDFPGL